MSDMTQTVLPEHDAARLDRFLKVLLPESGLRHRRRLCEDGRVLVNGIVRGPSFKVRPGQDVELMDHDSGAQNHDVRIVGRCDGFAAVFKPHGMHSAVIAGREDGTVEAMLPDLFPAENPVLLNRLDGPTSGIVLVALNRDARLQYERAQEAGELRKYYYARVQGRMMQSTVIRDRLDMANRKKTRLTDDVDPDSARWTEVEPIECGMEADSTLVRCLIRRGARHQIRAHLSGTGHPIVGDVLYGGPEASRLFLHHYFVEGPGFSFVVDDDFS
jgi:23S rRNA pseudouridine1911/1915/1917 synthase